MNDIKIKRIVTALTVVGGILSTYIFRKTNVRKIKTSLKAKEQKRIDTNLLTPANETFAITWGIIYAGILALVIHQQMNSQFDNPRYEASQKWLRLNFILGTVFSYFFSKSDKKHRIGASITTIAMLPASIALHRSLQIGSFNAPEPENLFQKSISLYTGWLTAASAISINSIARELGYLKNKSDAKLLTTLELPLLTVSGILASKQLKDPYYMLTLAGAFVGIAAKQKKKNEKIAKIALVMALTIIGQFTREIYVKSKMQS